MPPVDERLAVPDARPGPPAEAEILAVARMIDAAETVAIFGGEGCAGAEQEVVELARTLNAPVGYTLRGKSWLEAGNPNAVGMTGLIGYGAAYDALHDADLLLLLGTDFPYTEFLPQSTVKVIQIDADATRLGRRVPLDRAVTGDVGQTIQGLLQRVTPKTS